MAVIPGTSVDRSSTGAQPSGYACVIIGAMLASWCLSPRSGRGASVLQLSLALGLVACAGGSEGESATVTVGDGSTTGESAGDPTGEATTSESTGDQSSTGVSGATETSTASASATTTAGTTTEATTEATTGATTDDSTTRGEPPEPPEPLELPPADPPVDVPPGVLFSENIPCGPHPDNVFDVFLPDADGPTPMVVYIHGGGFTGGDKSAAYNGQNGPGIGLLLEAGIAFATLNYRLLDEVDDEGVAKPLGDSRRCLQFMRYHAKSLNLDKPAIAAVGGSAGAGTSLWLGSHDDMADPGSPDPVLRESSRVRAVGILETQATYDLVRWETDIFASYGFTLELAVQLGLEQRLLSFYGIDSLDQIEGDPEIVAYRADVDMLALMDAGDAPVWITSVNVAEVPPTNTGILFHHPYHARAVMDRANEVGVDQIAYIPELGIADPSGVDLIEFLIDELQ